MTATFIESVTSVLTPASLMGLPAFQVMLLLTLATLLSEDLACVSAGLLSASGQLPLTFGVLACGIGIWIGDVLLYALGRTLRAGLFRAEWLRRRVPEAKLAEAEKRLAEKGTRFLVASRFLPGSRLPGYLAAGALRYPLTKFMLIMALAVAVWTPLLCLLSLTLGMTLLPWLHDGRLWILIPAAWLLIATAVKFIPMLFSWRGRRLLLSRWTRITRWEFWPSWAFYTPVAFWIAWLCLRHRSLAIVTLCNPGIRLSGLAMESKSDILTALSKDNPHAEAIATWASLPPGEPAERLAALNAFMQAHQLSYPIVLKPDVGERGQGVAIIRSEEAALSYLTACRGLVIAQRHIGGLEFGIFYTRQPGAARGEIISLAQKHPFSLRGDGQHTLEELILTHPRALAMAGYFEKKFGEAYTRTPDLGEEVKLAEIGTHCRGAIFTDARQHLTEALSTAVNDLTTPFEGFHYGRYDLRVPSLEDLRAGRNLQVLELNGMTAEPVHIYDPAYPLTQAWKDVAKAWSFAFAAGAALRQAGHPVPTLRDIRAVLSQHRHHDWFEADSLHSAPSHA
jgi:membrane protein DedA with SNARE-associated domain